VSGAEVLTSNATKRIIIKVHRSATSLAADWTSGNSMWIAMTNSVTKAANVLRGRYGLEPSYDGLVFMQGETDALDASKGAAYGTNLSAFIADFRGFVGTNCPVVVGRISSAPTQYIAGASVRTAQTNAATALPSVAWVDTDDLSLVDDQHYSGASLVTLGQRFAAALKALTP
jgi:hypothetical protein